MPDAPVCPWCGASLPRMMLDRYATGLDDLPCPKCGKGVPERLVRSQRT